MAEEANAPKTGLIPPSRRDVVAKAAQVAVTAPAVALLLNATSKNAFAQITPYIDTGHLILDDFTFGSSNEDIDGVAFGTNFNPLNGQINQDDHIF